MGRTQLTGKRFKSKVRQLRERDGDHCVWCREIVLDRTTPKHPRNPSLEHVIPWRVCQSYHLDVLALAHVECNQLSNNRGTRRSRCDSLAVRLVLPPCPV